LNRIAVNNVEEAMYGKSFLIGTAILAGASFTQAQTSTAAAASKDHAFLSAALMGGMAEVDLGRLASGQASNEKVKMFGQKMVTDHSKAGDELKTLAASKQVTAPSDLDAKHKSEHERFAKMSAADFDRAYVADMVADHKKDVADFEKEAKSGQDPEVKAWAAKTLPTLQEHLRMIEDLQKTIGARKTATK
jgi:putative membrane protein